MKIRLSSLKRVIASEVRRSLREGQVPVFRSQRVVEARDTAYVDSMYDSLPVDVREFYDEGLEDGEFTEILDVWPDLDTDGTIEVMTDGAQGKVNWTWTLNTDDDGFKRWFLSGSKKVKSRPMVR